MKKLFIFIAIFMSVSVLSANYQAGKKIFEKKCVTCHGKYINKKVLEYNFYKKNNQVLKLKAPTVNMLAYFIKTAPKHIGEKSDPEVQRLEINDFIQTFVYHPNIKNSVIPNHFLKYFGKMKSMKGKISQSEISDITDYLFEYKKRRKKIITKVRLKSMSVKESIKEAKKENKHILIEAMSTTCFYCRRMKKEVISLPKIQDEINKNYIYITVDIDKTKLPSKLEKVYKNITPTFFVLNSDGKLLKVYPGAWVKSDFKEILKENLKN